MATGEGAGIAVEGGATLSIRNSIISKNYFFWTTSDQGCHTAGGGTILSLDYNIDSSNTIVFYNSPEDEGGKGNHEKSEQLDTFGRFGFDNIGYRFIQ